MTETDPRWGNKERKLLATTKFPPEFNTKVDMSKVRFTVLKPWISKRVTEVLGLEDEVVIEFIFGLLEENKPDPKLMQINLTGFLEKNTPAFVLDLWRLLISAQESPLGIPSSFVEEKKQQVRQRMMEEERTSHRIRQATDRRGDSDSNSNSHLDEIRQRERDERRRDRESERHRSPREVDRYEPSHRRRDRSRDRSRDRETDRSRDRDRYRDRETDRDRERRRHRSRHDDNDERDRDRDRDRDRRRRHDDDRHRDERPNEDLPEKDEFGREVRRRSKSSSPPRRRRSRSLSSTRKHPSPRSSPRNNVDTKEAQADQELQNEVRAKVPRDKLKRMHS